VDRRKGGATQLAGLAGHAFRFTLEEASIGPRQLHLGTAASVGQTLKAEVVKPKALLHPTRGATFESRRHAGLSQT